MKIHKDSFKVKVFCFSFILALVIFSGTIFFKGNEIVKSAGLFDEPNIIFKKGNYFCETDEATRQRHSLYPKNEKIETGNVITFINLFKNGLTKESLDKVQEFTKDLKKVFPVDIYGISSLAIDQDFRDIDGEIEGKPYINQELLDNFDNEIKNWKQRVIKDKTAYPRLIAKDWSYANVILYIPNSANEIKEYRKVVEFLEGRAISDWEFMFKKDINPIEKYSNIYPSGWCSLRELMKAIFYNELGVNMIIIGSLIAGIVFFFLIGSYRQVFIEISGILFAYWITRGLYGLVSQYLNFVGLPLYERIYNMLGYITILFNGTTFYCRYFEMYNYTRKLNPENSRLEIWRKVRMFSPEGMTDRIILAGLISVIGFLLLYQINIYALMEVGIFSAIGICVLLLMTYFYIPAMHILIGGETQNKNALHSKIESKLDKICAWIYGKIVIEENKKTYNILSAITAIKIVGAVTFVAVTLFILDQIILNPIARVKVAFALLMILNIIYFGFCLYKKKFGRKKVFWICAVLILFGLMGNYFLDRIDLSKNFKFLTVGSYPITYTKGNRAKIGADILNAESGYGFEVLTMALRPKKSEYASVLDDPEFIFEVNSFEEEVRDKTKINAVFSIIDKMNIIDNESKDIDIKTEDGASYASFLIEESASSGMRKQSWNNKEIIVAFTEESSSTITLAGIRDDILEIAKKYSKIDSGFENNFFGRTILFLEQDYFILKNKPINAGTTLVIMIIIVAIWIFIKNKKYCQSVGVSLNPLLTGMAIAAPFVFSFSVIIIILMILRKPFEQSVACFTVLTVSSAIDYSIHSVADFQAKYLKTGSIVQALRYSVLARGKINIIDALINISNFLVLNLSVFPPLRDLGSIMIVMTFLSLFGVLYLLPSLLPLCVRSIENKTEKLIYNNKRRIKYV